MKPIKLIETAVTETDVYMRYADHRDPEEAEQWLDFQVPLSALKHPYASQPTQLDKLERQDLGIIQWSAIKHIQQILLQQENALTAALQQQP
jgi:hypothetical protein